MRAEKLLSLYKLSFKGAIIIRRFAREKLENMGVYIPLSVQFLGEKISFPHPIGIIIHPDTVIEDNVKIYQNVTIGRGDIFNDEPADDFKGFIIKKGAILCAGSKVLCTHGKRIIGEGSVVGANSVVTEDVPDNAIVAGIPAKVIGYRNH